MKIAARNNDDLLIAGIENIAFDLRRGEPGHVEIPPRFHRVDGEHASSRMPMALNFVRAADLS